MRFRSLFISLAVAQLAVGAALAEDKSKNGQQAPTPVSSQPEMTSATYDSWTLHCERRPQIANDQKICEIAEAVVPQNQKNPIARIGIGHPPDAPKGQLRLTVILPPNIYIPTAPHIKAKDDLPGLVLTWKRCFAGGCFADAMMTPDEVKTWKAIAADTGRVTFTEAVGRNLAIQYSLRGFAQAFDALEKTQP